MKKNQLYILISIIVLIVIIGVIGFFVMKNRVPTPVVASFTVERPNFVAVGQSFGRVEVWGVSTNPKFAPGDDLHLTNMLRKDDVNGNQYWAAAIPTQPLQLKNIYMVVYNENGDFFASTSLPYANAAEILSAVWGIGGTSTATTTR